MHIIINSALKGAGERRRAQAFREDDPLPILLVPRKWDKRSFTELLLANYVSSAGCRVARSGRYGAGYGQRDEVDDTSRYVIFGHAILPASSW